MDNRDYVIAQLERKLENTKNEVETERKEKNHYSLKQELEDTKKEASNLRQTIVELRYLVDQYNAENDILNEDKRQLEEQIQSQQDVLDLQKKEILATKEIYGDVKKRQRDDIEEQYKLELENKR